MEFGVIIWCLRIISDSEHTYYIIVVLSDLCTPLCKTKRIILKQNKNKKSEKVSIAFYFAKILVQFSYNNTYSDLSTYPEIYYIYTTRSHMYAYLQSLCMCPIRIMQYIFYVNTKTDLKTLRFKLLTTKVHNAQCNSTMYSICHICRIAGNFLIHKSWNLLWVVYVFYYISIHLYMKILVRE